MAYQSSIDGIADRGQTARRAGSRERSRTQKREASTSVLATKTEVFNEGAVALEVATLQISQEASAASDEHQQAAA